MKLFNMGKKCEDERFCFGIWWVKWLQKREGQGYIFHTIIPAHNVF